MISQLVRLFNILNLIQPNLSVKGSIIMKTFRIMLALVILLSLNSLSAFAQASATTSFAYISLFPAKPVVSTGKNASLPIEMQSQRAYEKLFPALVNARRQGVIVQFRPELSAGMVKVEYTTGVNLAPLLGDRFSIFNDPAPILENMRIYGRRTTGSLDTPALYTSRFYLHPKEGYFYGYNFPADRYFKFTLTDSSGKLMAVEDAYTSTDGYFWGYFGWGTWSAMEPGYTFTARMYLLDRTTLVKTFSSTIPNLRVTSIDVASKTANGTAPANSNLMVELYHLNLNAFGNSSSTTNFLVTPASGQWQTTFTTPIRGYDEVYLVLEPGANFYFSTYLTAPYISTGLGSNYSYLHGTPYAPASMTIRHAGFDYSFTGKFNNRGDFFAQLLKPNGAPMFMQVGDKVSGTGVTALTIPAMTASVDPATDIFSGTAPASQYLYVYLYVRNECTDYSCWYGYGDYLKSTPAGTFSDDFSSVLDILLTDTLDLEVDYINPGNGNVVWYENLISP